MSGDSYFNYVVLGLAGDSFTDFSNYHNAITNVGVSLTTQYPGVLASSWGFIDPTPAKLVYATLPANAQIGANQDFTLEASAYIIPAEGEGGTLLSTRTYGPGVSGLYLGYTSDGTVFVRCTHQGSIVIEIDAPKYLSILSPSLHTFSLDRVNGQFTLYIDGKNVIDTSHKSYYSGALDIGDNLCIGGDGFESNMTGGMSQIRFTVGVVRHKYSYVPASQAFPKYYAVDGVVPNVFGELASNISTAGAVFSTIVNISDVGSAIVTVTSASGTTLASGWQLTQIYGTQYRLTGISPTALITYLVTVVVTVPSELGGGTNSHTYLVTNTAAGVLSAGQALLTSIPNLALWLDASESTSVISNATTHAVVQLLDRSGGIEFSPAAGTVPVLDFTSWSGKTGVAFSNVSASGLVPAKPVVVSDTNSNSTVFLVGRYSGSQLGQGAGNFTMAYGADTTLADGLADWNIVTSSVGAPASASAYDSSVIQNSVATSASITSGQKFLVVWKSTTNAIQIYVNQVLVATTVVHGSANLWSAVNAAIGFIGGAIAPNGAFISIAEIIAFKSNLDSSTMEGIESYLNHKWTLYTAIPYAATPDNLIGFQGVAYQARVIVTDATSVSVTGNSGTGWSIVPSGTGVLNQYLITATMPAVVGYLNMTITSHNGAVVGTDTYVINVQTLPTIPVIAPPTNSACQVSSGYVGLIEILHSTSVTITGSSGSGWTILPIVSGVENYIITGTMPAQVSSVVLTINATGATGSASAQFTINATAASGALPTQYPLDVTGGLNSNLITNESHTLTASTGMVNQLIRPTLTPFFAHGFSLSYYSVGTTLSTAVPLVDYYPIYELQDISTVTAYPVYGAIRVVNPAITGTVFITYQTLGGNFAANNKQLLEQLVYAQMTPATAVWSNIPGSPTYYPVNDHPLNVQTEAVGFSGLAAAVAAIASSISALNVNADVPAMLAHMGTVNNPHNLTKANIGLGNVNNYPLATNAEATAGITTTAYLTPATAYLALVNRFPAATTSAMGGSLLNAGANAAAASNSTSYLTAAGLRQLATAQGTIPTYLGTKFITGSLSGGQQSSNALTSIMLPAMTMGQITPAPVTFPLWWWGKQYTSLAQLVADISAYVGMGPLPYSASGIVWFPTTVTVPSLVTSSTAVYGSIKSSVKMTVAQPLATTF